MNQNFSAERSEKAALLEFKDGLRDPHSLLSSWEGSECCNWRGVSCDNEIEHVVSLDLGYRHLFDGPSTAWRLSGEITPLLGLKHLNYLDLSFNDFRGIGIPEFIGSMQELSYLNLSNAGFGGRIPSHIGNLSRLQYLDLNSFYSWYTLYADDLQWLSHLSSLQYLDMNSVNLAKADDWLYAINMLPVLSVLYFPNCQLKEFTTHLAVSNLTSLASLDLSNNQFISMLPNWLYNMSKLECINLQFNQLQGSIPDAFANMTSLEVIQLRENQLLGGIPQSIRKLCNLRILDLSSNNITDDVSILAKISSECAGGSLEILNLRGNNLVGNLSDWLAHLKVLTFLDLGNNLLQGTIPASIGNISTLRSLSLSHNTLNGTLPESIGQLSTLNLFDVSHNSLSGTISEVHFQNLSKLEHLSLGSNSFVFNMSSDWEPPFRLRLIGLRRCRIGPKFPPWLMKQTDYNILDLSYAEINDTAPDWIWNYYQHIFLLDLSHNQITGEVPGRLKYASMSNIDLSFNRFEGPLPGLPASIEYIDFSGNSFSGTIFPLFAQPMLTFSHLIITNNIINGTIPDSICNYLDLFVINLSGNLLYGELPECWADLGG
ncbi:putative non-specific serine/threonine protein kinase [Dioscorea sansibarensis]